MKITERHRRRTLNIMRSAYPYPADLAEILTDECIEQAATEKELLQLIGAQLLYGTAGDDDEPTILRVAA